MFDLLTLEAAASATGSRSNIGMIVLLVVMVAGMYFLMIRPQRKQQKKDQEMRESTQVGDEITTIGGIMGRVVTVKEDSLIIETGADRNKMKIARWAIQVNNTATEKMRAEQEAAKAAAAKEREEKAAAKKKKSKKDNSDKA
ncbi:MAG TPA: preprotein translocase subunit YajC [Candidatus Fimenecus stercoravium]|nr:preprotein translocase subunit YajC [Candidatus Fimenecus stercoravium]